MKDTTHTSFHYMHSEMQTVFKGDIFSQVDLSANLLILLVLNSGQDVKLIAFLITYGFNEIHCIFQLSASI